MNEVKKVDVNITSCATAVPYITFAFCILAFVFAANCLGVFDEGGTLAIGLCQLGCYGVYHIGTMKLSDTGDVFATNIYGIFACVFAGVGGVANVGAALCTHFNIPFDGRVSAIAYFLSGVILIVFVPTMLHNAKADFFVFLGGGIGCLGCGLAGFGILTFLMPLYACGLAACGIAGMFNVFHALFGCFGINVPTGKPFIPSK